MKRPTMAQIAAGALLAATALTGAAGTAAATADLRPQQATCTGTQHSAGPTGRMHAATNDSEFDYLAEMIAHHQEAVKAATQLRRSGRAEMRTLGASIVTTQSAEIATMKTWLATWYPGRRPAATDYHPMMRDLSKLSGDALDETFLQDMIPHHMTAVMMSQRLLMHGPIRHQEITGFARTVRDGQHAEMFQMQQYLADWFDSGRRTPCGPMGGPGDSSTPPSPRTGPSWTPGGMTGR